MQEPPVAKNPNDPDPFIPGSFSDDRSYLLKMANGDNADVPEGHQRSLSSKSDIPATIQEEMFPSNDLFSNSSSLTHSTVKVEITDVVGDGSVNLTTSALRVCKKQVLRPYWALLMFIGWRGFGKERVYSGSLHWRIVNVVYPSVIVLLLIYTYIYEMVACEWKLNLKKDTLVIVPTTTPLTTHAANTTNKTTIYPFVTMVPAKIITTNLSTDATRPPLACEHIITTYIIPNILHFVAYLMGLYYFRIQDNEQLYALMEKVFLQAAPLQNRAASQQIVVRKLRLFLVCGVLWVILTLVLQGLYVWAFKFPQLLFFKKLGHEVHWVLFAIELLGRMVLNSVILAVVVNYGTQCEMILFYVMGIALRLQEKSTDLKTAMKDMLLLRQSISLLNGTMSKMTSLTSVILAELSIIGVSILALNKYDLVRVWVYRSIFPVIWILMLSFPLFQAARVNSVCRRLKKISLEMRVFGYKNNSQLDLDSFLQFVGQTRLKAKLFHIPIQPSYVISILVLTAFVLLILFQTSSIGPIDYIF
ncbi:uncharacterized protein LOC121375421 [Gigantopelta aegis]|uniref:uncharacterized protein LOC121375421 n=1 Tax=Gigantopelta aegis TaxID=1735272 RepID=UPI001B887CB9|nr:uncharacterized protein LOC121375421 [Gigantopelta aegis]